MMTLKDYLNQIKFLFLQPQDKNLPPLTNPIAFEIANTQLPEVQTEVHYKLSELCSKIPKMSTYAIGSMIAKILSHMPPEHIFLNIGVWYGFSFFAGAYNYPDKRCIGVDNFSQWQWGLPKQDFLNQFQKCKTDNHSFFEMDYLDYLKQHQGTIGFYIYDGEHSYENQLQALKLAEPYFSENCVILIDDLNLIDVERSIVDFIAQSDYSYEVLFTAKTNDNLHPTFWNGIQIFQRIT